jgi:hypothetical protein
MGDFKIKEKLAYLSLKKDLLKFITGISIAGGDRI